MTEVAPLPPKPEEPGDTSGRLATWAGSLVARSGGLLKTIDVPDPRDIIYQDLDRSFYPSVLPPLGEIISEQSNRAYTHNRNWLINEASRLFAGNSFYREVMGIRSNKQLLNELRQIVTDGGNVAILTNHPLLVSPFIDQLAIDAAFLDISISQRMDIVINKALAWIDFPASKHYETAEISQNINCVEIGTEIANAYCCVPDSDSAELHGLASYGDKLNRQMLDRLTRKLRRGGRIVTFAGSGSLDLMPTPEIPQITMKPASAATAKLIGKHFSHGLFAVSWVNPENRELAIRLSDSLVPLHNSQDVHDLMQQMEVPYYELVNGSAEPGGIPVHYDYPS